LGDGGIEAARGRQYSRGRDAENQSDFSEIHGGINLTRRGCSYMMQIA